MHLKRITAFAIFFLAVFSYSHSDKVRSDGPTLTKSIYPLIRVRNLYWEAHEAWEHLWIALGRSGSEADIIKGLIKLAACGVKCLEANPIGASRHALRAANLLDVTAKPDWLEIDLSSAHQIAANAAGEPPALPLRRHTTKVTRI